MTSTHTDTSVRRTVTVDVPIAHAFEVFTARFDSWWPRTHHIATVEMAEAVIEPRVGGRWYERAVDGSECEWGSVLAFDAPNYFALSWHLDGEWKYDAARASRVDVRFTAESATRTHVELVHSELDRHGDNWQQLRDGVSGDGGWGSLLEAFADAAARS